MKIVKIINHNFLYVDTGASAYFSLYLITFYQMFCVPKIYNSFKLLISEARSSIPPPNKFTKKVLSQQNKFSCNCEIG